MNRPMPAPDPYRFLFAVPNHRRDLEGHALVAYHLARRYGHEVRFTNVPGLHDAMLAEAPDVVVLDRVDLRADIARLAKSLGMKVALLPTVGFTQEGTEIEARRAGKHLSDEQLVDCCLVWGEHARAMLTTGASLPESAVHTVGCPRFDVYSEPYLALAEPRETLLHRLGITNPAAPLMVWATNTCHVRTRDLDGTVASAVASGVPEDEIRGQLADEATAFRDLAGATLTLARRHPEWNFVIKLHPAEVPGPYEEIASREPNIVLAADARIRDVLHHCTALICNTSTTATEAWMLGKPVFEVVFGTYRIPTPAGYEHGNHVVRDVDALEAQLTRCVGAGTAASIGDAQRHARRAFLERVYYRIDGRSSERCAERLASLVAGESDARDRRVRIRAAAAEALVAWRSVAERRAGARVRAALHVPADITLRFWTGAFWRQLAGAPVRTAWDDPITDAMVNAHFAAFDRVHGSSYAESHEASRVDGAPARATGDLATR